MKIIWSPKARENIQNIFYFVSRDSKIYAKKEVLKIKDSVERLSIFPDMGQIVSEIPNSIFREIVQNPYRIIYRRNENFLEIVTIIRVEKICEY